MLRNRFLFAYFAHRTTFLLYAIKSAFVLSILFVPYMLMLRNEKFCRFNRLTGTEDAASVSWFQVISVIYIIGMAFVFVFI